MLRCNAEVRTYIEYVSEDADEMVREELGFRPCRHRATRKVKGQPDLCASHRESIAAKNPNVRLRAEVTK